PPRHHLTSPTLFRSPAGRGGPIARRTARAMTGSGSSIVRLPFDEVADHLTRVLLREGFTEERARRCATIFTETHLDGVASHGLKDRKSTRLNSSHVK